MTKPRILVTGAIGKTGSLVVAELLKARYSVRAMVHREDARSARLNARGAQVAVADMSSVDRELRPAIALGAAACAGIHDLAARARDRRFLDVINWNSERRRPCWNNLPFS